MNCDQIIYSGHAVKRMFERAISELDIAAVIDSGELIAEYPQDTPYPSYLLLGFIGDSPLHVLIGKDDDSGDCYVVTTYLPMPDIWNDDFRTRRAAS